MSSVVAIGHPMDILLSIVELQTVYLCQHLGLGDVVQWQRTRFVRLSHKSQGIESRSWRSGGVRFFSLTAGHQLVIASCLRIERGKRERKNVSNLAISSDCRNAVVTPEPTSLWCLACCCVLHKRLKSKTRLRCRSTYCRKNKNIKIMSLVLSRCDFICQLLFRLTILSESCRYQSMHSVERRCILIRHQLLKNGQSLNVSKL